MKTCFHRQDSAISQTWNNSKMFNITSNYVSFFDHTPPANCVAHITRDFLIFCSCSYHSSIELLTNGNKYVNNEFEFLFIKRSHCVKSVRIRSFSGPCFPVFGQDTERYGVSLRI